MDHFKLFGSISLVVLFPFFFFSVWPALFHFERTGDLPEHEHRACGLRPTLVRQMRPRDDFGYVFLTPWGGG